MLSCEVSEFSKNTFFHRTQIETSFFLKIDYDPTTSHINKVNELATKWMSRNEIKKKWARYN